MQDKDTHIPPRVLIIESKLDVKRMLTQCFLRKGYEAYTVTNGMQGLENVKETSPDLILVACLLPDINGLKIARYLKYDANIQTVPIVLIPPGDQSEASSAQLEIFRDEEHDHAFIESCLQYSLQELNGISKTE